MFVCPAVFTVFVLLSAWCERLQAAETAPKAFNLPADVAENSLKQFAAQSGTEIVFATSTVGKVRTNAVKGNYRPREALKQMLANTALTLVEDAKTGTLMIHSAAPPKKSGQPSSPSTRTDDPEPKKKPMKQRTLIAVLSGWFAIGSSSAQVNAPASAAAKDETIELSPFTVNADKDVGYLAANSLTGSRLNTPLKDTAASISVLTEEFLKDLAAYDLTEALRYASNSQLDVDDDVPTDPSGNSTLEFYQRYRTRGVAAVVSRNYFKWMLPIDTYNTERIEDSRGPNAVMFGIGSAGGVIDAATKQASAGRSFQRATVSAGSFESYRGSIDVNQALLKGKLGVRLNAVLSHQNSFREYAFTDSRRVHLAAKYHVSATTRVRAEFERGIVSDNVPRNFALRTGVRGWLAAGRPTTAATTGTVAGTRRLATATPRLTYIANNDLLINMAGALITTDNRNFVLLDPSLADDSINVNGPGESRHADFNVQSVFLEHQFGKKTFVELAFNHQEYDFVTFDPSHPSTILAGDPNQLLRTGAANPFAGRYLLESFWSRRTRNERSDDGRMTASTEIDFGKWGRYRLAGMAEYAESGFLRNSAQEVLAGRPFNAAPENAANRVTRRNYITPGDWPTYYVNSPQDRGMIVDRTDPVTGRTFSTTWATTNANSAVDTPNNQTTFLLGGQGGYFGNRLIIGGGYRRDVLNSLRRFAVRDPVTNGWVSDYRDIPWTRQTGQSRTLSVVAHVTPRISLLYNQASNVDIPNPQITLTPGVLPGLPEGTGRDAGISFDLPEGRLYARMVYFETNSEGLVQFRFGNNGSRTARVLAALQGAGLINQAAVDARSFSSNGGITSQYTDGYEFQVTANPTKNWRLLVNFSLTDSVEDNIVPEVRAWAADAIAYWRSFNRLDLVTSSTGTIATEIDSLEDEIDNAISLEGFGTLGHRRYKVSALTRYTIPSGILKGLYVGGGYRHQSKMLIGREATTGVEYGNSFWSADFLAGYPLPRTPFGRRLNLQLNVTNVFDDTTPLVTRIRDGEVLRNVMQAPRTWRLTADYEF